MWRVHWRPVLLSALAQSSICNPLMLSLFIEGPLVVVNSSHVLERTWSWWQRVWFQRTWLSLNAWSVAITGSICVIGTNLVFFIIITELWNWHKSVVCWYIDVVRWHIGLLFWKGPQICKYFKRFNFGKPSFLQQSLVNFTWVLFENKVFEFSSSDDSFWLELIVSFVTFF